MVDNYRAISYLKIMWEVLTVIVAERMYGYQEKGNSSKSLVDGRSVKCEVSYQGKNTLFLKTKIEGKLS